MSILKSPVLNRVEDTLISEQHMLPINLALANDGINETIDPHYLLA